MLWTFFSCRRRTFPLVGLRFVFQAFQSIFSFPRPIMSLFPPHRLSRRISRSVVSCYRRKSSVASQPSFPSQWFLLFLLFSHSLLHHLRVFPRWVTRHGFIHLRSFVCICFCRVSSTLPSDDLSLHKLFNSPSNVTVVRGQPAKRSDAAIYCINCF